MLQSRRACATLAMENVAPLSDRPCVAIEALLGHAEIATRAATDLESHLKLAYSGIQAIVDVLGLSISVMSIPVSADPTGKMQFVVDSVVASIQSLSAQRFEPHKDPSFEEAKHDSLQELNRMHDICVDSDPAHFNYVGDGAVWDQRQAVCDELNKMPTAAQLPERQAAPVSSGHGVDNAAASALASDPALGDHRVHPAASPSTAQPHRSPDDHDRSMPAHHSSAAVKDGAAETTSPMRPDPRLCTHASPPALTCNFPDFLATPPSQRQQRQTFPPTEVFMPFFGSQLPPAARATPANRPTALAEAARSAREQPVATGLAVRDADAAPAADVIDILTDGSDSRHEHGRLEPAAAEPVACQPSCSHAEPPGVHNASPAPRIAHQTAYEAAELLPTPSDARTAPRSSKPGAPEAVPPAHGRLSPPDPAEIPAQLTAFTACSAVPAQARGAPAASAQCAVRSSFGWRPLGIMKSSTRRPMHPQAAPCTLTQAAGRTPGTPAAPPGQAGATSKPVGEPAKCKTDDVKSPHTRQALADCAQPAATLGTGSTCLVGSAQLASKHRPDGQHDPDTDRNAALLPAHGPLSSAAASAVSMSRKASGSQGRGGSACPSSNAGGGQASLGDDRADAGDGAEMYCQGELQDASGKQKQRAAGGMQREQGAVGGESEKRRRSGEAALEAAESGPGGGGSRHARVQKGVWRKRGGKARGVGGAETQAAHRLSAEGGDAGEHGGGHGAALPSPEGRIGAHPLPTAAAATATFRSNAAISGGAGASPLAAPSRSCNGHGAAAAARPSPPVDVAEILGRSPARSGAARPTGAVSMAAALPLCKPDAAATTAASAGAAARTAHKQSTEVVAHDAVGRGSVLFERVALRSLGASGNPVATKAAAQPAAEGGVEAKAVRKGKWQSRKNTNAIFEGRESKRTCRIDAMLRSSGASAGKATGGSGRAAPVLALEKADVKGGYDGTLQQRRAAAAAAAAGGDGPVAPAAARVFQQRVRKRGEREVLQAWECEACMEFYGLLARQGYVYDSDVFGSCEECGGVRKKSKQKGCGAQEAGPVSAASGSQPSMPNGKGGGAEALLQAAGRHRHQFVAPPTQENFWAIGFEDDWDAPKRPWRKNGVNKNRMVS
eukprot:jgi/Ulvmu1/10755/UM068_0045.1